MTKNVTIVGAGVMGLTTGQLILEMEPTAHVEIVCDRQTPYTTSDIAAGFWRPFYITDPDKTRLRRWCEKTFDRIEQLYRDNPAKYGITLLSGYELFKEPEEEDPYWQDIVYGFRHASPDELLRIGFGKEIRDAWFYSSYGVQMQTFMATIQQEFLNAGGRIIRKHLNSFDDLDTIPDILVNTTGSGAPKLVNDADALPIRGQIFRVKAPGIKQFFMEGDNYILPNLDWVVCGGTHQENDWNTDFSKQDAEKIWNGCTKLVPLLALYKSGIQDSLVGLRPGRKSVRVEKESLVIKGTQIPVVHNYGHGGSGVTLHYGCSLDAANLVVNELRNAA